MTLSIWLASALVNYIVEFIAVAMSTLKGEVLNMRRTFSIEQTLMKPIELEVLLELCNPVRPMLSMDSYISFLLGPLYEIWFGIQYWEIWLRESGHSNILHKYLGNSSHSQRTTLHVCRVSKRIHDGLTIIWGGSCYLLQTLLWC